MAVFFSRMMICIYQITLCHTPEDQNTEELSVDFLKYYYVVPFSYPQTVERPPCSLGNSHVSGRGQGLHKKGSIRESGDVIKRSRIQTA